jgi:hypothetical protein
VAGDKHCYQEARKGEISVLRVKIFNKIQKYLGRLWQVHLVFQPSVIKAL